MSSIAALMNKLSLPEGFSPSCLQGVRYFKHSQPVLRTPLFYEPGLCIVVQGHKTGYLGGRKISYNTDHYLVVPVFIQFECEAYATEAEPLLGLYIDIDFFQLQAIFNSLESIAAAPTATFLPLGMGSALMDDDMFNAVLRLLKTLQSDTETKILGADRVREVLFRAFCGNQAPLLYALLRNKGSFSGVARTLHLIQKDPSQKFTVSYLAQMAHLSPSAFYRAFKEVTQESPMQYVKKIRLTQANKLLRQGTLKVNEVSEQVGYESVSQFSREFKRYFKKRPLEARLEAYSL